MESWGVAVLIICVVNGLKLDELRNSGKLSNGVPAVHFAEMQKNSLIEISQGPVLTLEKQSSSTDPGVVDPAADDGIKKMMDVMTSGPPLAIPFVPLVEPKPKFISATLAMKDGDIGKMPIEKDRASQEVADPSSIERECPRARCPIGVKCSDPTYHCCQGANYSVCCPSSATCLNTDPPMCLEESVTDPNACTLEVCQDGFHCPLSKVGACCLGGKSCCPENGQCTGSDPPMCRALSSWEYLHRKHGAPVALIPGKGSNGREPIALIPVTASPTSAPGASQTTSALAAVPNSASSASTTQTPVPSGTPAPATKSSFKAKDNEMGSIDTAGLPAANYDQLPCPQCDQPLFQDQPNGPGERTRQRSFFISDGGKSFRITITEAQTSEKQPDGTLKTISRRIRTTTQLPADPDMHQLWADDTSPQAMTTAFSRLHQSANAGIGEVAARQVQINSEEKAKSQWKQQVKSDRNSLSELNKKVDEALSQLSAAATAAGSTMPQFVKPPVISLGDQPPQLSSCQCPKAETCQCDEKVQAAFAAATPSSSAAVDAQRRQQAALAKQRQNAVTIAKNLASPSSDVDGSDAIRQEAAPAAGPARFRALSRRTKTL